MFTQRGEVCSRYEFYCFSFHGNDKDKQPVIVFQFNDGDFQQVCNDISPVCGNLTK